VTSFLHSGDLGDIIASLPTIRHLGGGEIHLADRPWTKAVTPRVHLIAPLLEAQGYIIGVQSGEQGAPTFDFSTFRTGGLPWGVSLGAIQAAWLGVNPEQIDWCAPWLTVTPDKTFTGKVVIARSARYHNYTFPWRDVVDAYEDQIVFVGLPLEHADFCREFGRQVAFHPTKNLLEVAAAIKGSFLFIGNQSSPFNIAEGLKHPRILEACLWVPDCCYGGGNFQYVPDGHAVLNDPRGYGAAVTTKVWEPEIELNRSITPPGGWIYAMPNGDKIKGTTFDQAKWMIMQNYRNAGVPAPAPEDIAEALAAQTLKRLPEVGQSPSHKEHLEICARIRALCPLTIDNTQLQPQ